MWKRNKQGLYLQRPEVIIPEGHLALFLNDALTGKLKDYQIYKNLVTNAGKESIAEALIGTSNREITYCAVGTDDTAPVASNTVLGAELDRKLISTREISAGAGNASVFTTFFNTGEANGTLKEIALFGDNASGTANSGTMYTHADIDRTKSSSDTLTVEYTILVG